MNTPLPALNGLRAFEATARYLSMTEAAKELHVTPGALSHQIRALEDFLGVKLFERGVRSLTLTREGEYLFPGLQSGFGQIREAVGGLRSLSADNVLVISSTHGFTARWLASRLYDFASSHPELDARVSSSFHLANFVSDGVDVAIRILPRDYVADDALQVHKLIEFAYIPVCSPTLLERHGAVENAADLIGLPIIHDEAHTNEIKIPFWAQWYREQGVDTPNLESGIRFNSADPAINAAVQGAGLLLASNILAYDDLSNGRLVAPIPHAVASNSAFYLVYTRTSADHKPVCAFRDWIIAKFEGLDREKLVLS
ncbi:MAG: transcriptional regulator [Rhodospirillaceae bacterium]|nr:transcriptional regulator [Rhodospirillaceae bacterium]|tara:strand:- start:413 stop:1351 length:939 start_codon:yes stop_codon:yes gene_type:complete